MRMREYGARLHLPVMEGLPREDHAEPSLATLSSHAVETLLLLVKSPHFLNAKCREKSNTMSGNALFHGQNLGMTSGATRVPRGAKRESSFHRRQPLPTPSIAAALCRKVRQRHFCYGRKTRRRGRGGTSVQSQRGDGLTGRLRRTPRLCCAEALGMHQAPSEPAPTTLLDRRAPPLQATPPQAGPCSGGQRKRPDGRLRRRNVGVR